MKVPDRPVSGASNSAELMYDNEQLLRNQVGNDTSLDEEEIYENDPNRIEQGERTLDVGIYEPIERRQDEGEEHYKVPMKVISVEDLTAAGNLGDGDGYQHSSGIQVGQTRLVAGEEGEVGETDLHTEDGDKRQTLSNVRIKNADTGDNELGDMKYQDARSKLKRVNVLEKDINEKTVDTSLGESYLQARSKLRSSNKALTFSPPPSVTTVSKPESEVIGSTEEVAIVDSTKSDEKLTEESSGTNPFGDEANQDVPIDDGDNGDSSHYSSAQDLLGNKSDEGNTEGSIASITNSSQEKDVLRSSDNVDRGLDGDIDTGGVVTMTLPVVEDDRADDHELAENTVALSTEDVIEEMDVDGIATSSLVKQYQNHDASATIPASKGECLLCTTYV